MSTYRDRVEDVIHGERQPEYASARQRDLALLEFGVRLGLEAAAKLDVTGFGMVRVDALLAIDPAAVLREEPSQNDNG